MKSFAEEMSFYSAYHQEKRNIFIHLVGVPLISFSLLIILAWIKIPMAEIGGYHLTVATVFTVGVLIYYFMLDAIFATAATVLFGSLLAGAHYVAASLGPWSATGWAIFAGAQIFGWGTQFYGHFIFEKSRPALFDNLFQAVFSAPLFVVADIFFELGFRKDVEQQVKDQLRAQGKLCVEAGESIA